jgi:hypothetical protein
MACHGGTAGRDHAAAEWFPLNMYELSSWARGTVFALMLLQAKKPSVKVPGCQAVLELYLQPPHLTKFHDAGRAACALPAPYLPRG